MAHFVNKLIATEESPEQKYLVISGRGHMEYFCGVPERILK
jgi:hypothetical protein